MKKTLALTVAILMIGLLATTASAAGKEYATKGVVEFGGSAGYCSTTTTRERGGTKLGETTISVFQLKPAISYFVIDSISVGGMLDIKSITTERKPVGEAKTKATSSETTFYLTPKYIFKTEGMYPYVGLLVGLDSSGNGTTTSLTRYGLEGGVKVKVVDGGLLNAGISYVMGSGKEKRDAVETDIKSKNTFALEVGFSLYR